VYLYAHIVSVRVSRGGEGQSSWSIINL